MKLTAALLASACLAVFSLASAESGMESTAYGLVEAKEPISCGKFLSQVAEPYYKNYWMTYTAGYLTGLNQARYRSTAGFDLEASHAWLFNYCTQKPLEQLIAAFAALDKVLGTGAQPVYADRFLKK